MPVSTTTVGTSGRFGTVGHRLTAVATSGRYVEQAMGAGPAFKPRKDFTTKTPFSTTKVSFIKAPRGKR